MPAALFSDPVFTDLHDDLFSCHARARQALGPVGLALGWTPMLQGKVRREASAGLDAFYAKALGSTFGAGSPLISRLALSPDQPPR